MTEVKFPVIVRVNREQSFKWLTLEQANKRFVVIDNRLIVNNIEPLSLTYAEFLLEQYQTSLADSQKYFDFLCEDAASCKNERFISECLMPKLDKCKVDIKNAEHDISFLNKAIDFLNNYQMGGAECGANAVKIERYRYNEKTQDLSIYFFNYGCYIFVGKCSKEVYKSKYANQYV